MNKDLYCHYSDLPSVMAYEKQTLFKIEKNMKTLDLTNLDNSDIKKCLNNGSLLASKVIQKIGARLQ